MLKYGAMIVDALRTFRQPVMVYIPSEGELRGGAWVVIDATINPRMMEFYAADASRGGVLEPEGIVDIKFRSDDLLKAMRRTLPHLASLAPAEAARVEKELLPLFKQARYDAYQAAMRCMPSHVHHICDGTHEYIYIFMGIRLFMYSYIHINKIGCSSRQRVGA